MKQETLDMEEQRGADLLARLDTEPDRAMEALVEQYTPLICHVASKLDIPASATGNPGMALTSWTN